MIFQKEIFLNTKGFDCIYDITDKINEVVKESQIRNGIVNVFLIGSTASITTIEFEDGLIQDIKDILNKIIPRGVNYNHNKRWHDGNGDAHLKSSLIGPQITLPIKDNNLILGTWQQIILIDSDNKERRRKIFITIIGE